MNADLGPLLKEEFRGTFFLRQALTDLTTESDRRDLMNEIERRCALRDFNRMPKFTFCKVDRPDALNMIMSFDGTDILESIQLAVEDVDRTIHLKLAPQGSCMEKVIEKRLTQDELFAFMGDYLTQAQEVCQDDTLRKTVLDFLELSAIATGSDRPTNTHFNVEQEGLTVRIETVVNDHVYMNVTIKPPTDRVLQ